MASVIQTLYNIRMMIKFLLYAAFLSVLVACNTGASKNQDNKVSQSLVGEWEAETCFQLSDQNGQAINAWSKTLYAFTDSGLLTFYRQGYFDANCIQVNPNFFYGTFLTLSLGPTPVPASSEISFTEVGSIPLQSGLNGNKIVFHIELTQPTQNVDVIALYTNDNDKVCFTDSFVVNQETIDFTYNEIEPINYSNCLIK